MSYILAYSAISSIAAVVFWIRWRDAESRLRMPTLPLKLPPVKRKKARGRR